MKKQRDVTKIYPTSEFIAKLRRLADSLESGAAFDIQIQAERIHVPRNATCSIEHERDGTTEEIEFQVTWSKE